MKTFKVTLSQMDNPDKLKFILIQDCSDIQECIDYVDSTEKGFVINAIKEMR